MMAFRDSILATTVSTALLQHIKTTQGLRKLSINSLSQAFTKVILNAEAARNQNIVCAVTFFYRLLMPEENLQLSLKSLYSVVKV